jgi:hypothetical protein
MPANGETRHLPPGVAFAPSALSLGRVLTLILLAPLFLAFELGQLVLSERYLGIKQIARGADPRSLGLSEVTAFFWSVALIAYWLWMMMLLVPPFGRVFGISLLAVSLIGFSMRRNSGLKWVLVILTFEGAIRIGLLLSLCVMAWRRF